MSSRLSIVPLICILGSGLYGSSPAANAQATKIAPERMLFGSWHGAGGDWALTLGTDKSAVMEAGLTTNGGKSIDWRKGTFALSRGAWTLNVKDIDRREYVYSMVSLSPDELNLIDTSGKFTRFFRTREVSLKSLAGRWLGPGGDYNLITNNDRSASLEIGVAGGFNAYSEVRVGTFAMHDGFWTMTVRKFEVTKNDLGGPAYSYAMISNTPYQMDLVDAKGNVLKFHRLGEPFESLAPGLGQK